MPKPAARSTSRYSRDAIALLGQLIRLGRLERKLTLAELAERADVSRGLLQRIERGEPGCSIGAVLEVAAIVGVKLFDADQHTLAANVTSNQKMLTLLPQTARPSRKKVKDDF